MIATILEATLIPIGYLGGIAAVGRYLWRIVDDMDMPELAMVGGFFWPLALLFLVVLFLVTPPSVRREAEIKKAETELAKAELEQRRASSVDTMGHIYTGQVFPRRNYR